MAAILDQDTDRKSVRNHFIHSLNFREQIVQELGVIDGEFAFGRNFLAMGPFMELLENIEVGLQRGRLKTTRKFDEDALYKIKKIWYDNTYMVTVRDPFHPETVLRRDIAYSNRIDLASNEEILQLPSLHNMNPTDHVKDEQMFLGIREPVNIPEAMESLDYQQVTLVGQMTYDFRERKKPQFESQEDMDNSKGQVMDVGRPYFHAVIDFLHYWFKKQMYILRHDIDEMCLDDQKTTFNEIPDDRKVPQFVDELD